MKENAMVMFLLKKYVDDNEVITENMEVGTRWNGSSLESLQRTQLRTSGWTDLGMQSPCEPGKIWHNPSFLV